jgi:predicted transcriptional regulator
VAQPVTEPPPAPTSVDERITAVLLDAAGALTVNELRTQCRVRNATLYERLAALTHAGRIQRTCDGYRLAARN